MKKILSVILALFVLLSVIPLAVFAKDAHTIQSGWYFADGYKFYDENDNEVTPDAFNNGAYTQCWSDGFWWDGFAGTKGHDSHGAGKYVTSEITGNKFRVYFCNSNGDCDTNAQIYVDGTLKKTYNLFVDGGGNQINYAEVELETAGKHTVKVLNGGLGNNPDGSGWNGMPFNCITYTDTTSGSETYTNADTYIFTDANGQTMTPGGEGAWREFTYWTAEGLNGYEVNAQDPDSGNGYSVTTIVHCSSFRVVFANGDSNTCLSFVNVYVDGELVLENFIPGLAATTACATLPINVQYGRHTIKVEKVGGIGWQAMPFAGIQYVKPNTGALPTATSGWEMHYSDDFSYLNIVELATGKVVSIDDVKNVPDGNCIGTESGIQVYHHANEGHLQSANSFGIMPNYHVVVKFNGTGIHIGASFRNTIPMGLKVFVDGEEITNPFADNECAPDMNDGHHIVPTIIAGVEGLDPDNHVVEIYSTTACRFSFDWYEVPTGTTAYVDMPKAIVSYTDADDNGKIDDLVITASVKNDGKQYGIIIGENTYATKGSMKLAKDSGNALFTKYCDKYDAILVSAVYDDAEISSVNLGGELGDKVIALNWKNMTEYETFAARVFCIDGDDVMYGPITTVSLTEASSLLPLAE